MANKYEAKVTLTLGELHMISTGLTHTEGYCGANGMDPTTNEDFITLAAKVNEQLQKFYKCDGITH